MKTFIRSVLRKGLICACVLSIALCFFSCGGKKSAEIEVKIPENEKVFPSSSDQNRKLEFDR